MSTLVLLLLGLAMLFLLRNARASRRDGTRSIRTKVPSWLLAPPDAEMDMADAARKKRRRRRRAPAADTAELAPVGDTAAPVATPSTAGRAPEGVRSLISRRPTRADLRAAIVWSVILAPPRGLAFREGRSRESSSTYDPFLAADFD
jgi:hypothetical protein